MSDSRKLTDDQRYSLISEVVGTYVYQVFKSIFAPVDEQYKRRPWDNPFDWTGLWETASEDIAAIVAPKFKVMHTQQQAENLVAAIAGRARKELMNRIDLSDTDFRLGYNESWDRWLERMKEVNWDESEGYYVAGEYVSDSVDDVIEHLADLTAPADLTAMVELRRADEDPQHWTRKTFIAAHNE